MRQLFVWNERSGDARGPFELETVEELYENGVLEPQTLVSARGEELWTSLSEHTYTSGWFESMGPSALEEATNAADDALYQRARAMQDGHPTSAPIRHAAYDPHYELEFLELNSVSHRRLRDFALLAGGLNLALATIFIMAPMSPVLAAFLVTGFVGGNTTLSWIFGLVLRY